MMLCATLVLCLFILMLLRDAGVLPGAGVCGGVFGNGSGECWVKRNRDALEQFLMPLVIADFDTQAAIMYGELRAVLEKAGTLIGALDVLIAAHALSLNVILVTNNTREFSRVPGLQIANWATE